MSHKQSSRTIIPDPYGDLPVRNRQSMTPYVHPCVHTYFTRTVFAGTPGAIAATLNTLIAALHQQLLAEGITSWQPDNEQRVAAILKRVNFRSEASIPPPAKRAPRRRTDPPLAVPSPQPECGVDVASATP